MCLTPVVLNLSPLVPCPRLHLKSCQTAAWGNDNGVRSLCKDHQHDPFSPALPENALIRTEVISTAFEKANVSLPYVEMQLCLKHQEFRHDHRASIRTVKTNALENMLYKEGNV